MKTTMKKKWKIIILIILVFMTIAISLFSLRRYCWKGFNYFFCDSPVDGVYFSNITVTDNLVSLYASSYGSAALLYNYAYNIEDNVLYFGVKGRFMAKTEPHLKIEISTEERIEKIVAKGFGKEKVIYPTEETE